MSAEEATFWFNAIYVAGILGWIGIWFAIGGPAAMHRNKFLWAPFLFCIAILAFEILLSYGRLQVVNFEVEQSLLQVLETNSQKLIQAILGSLIIAPVLTTLRGNRPISREFLIYQSLALIFIVVGVLPVYWIPFDQLDWLFTLRHFKTIPYTYCICFFLSGVLVLLQELTDAPESDPSAS